MSTHVTAQQAADALNVSEQRVRTLCRQGVLAARKIGTNWLIEEQSVSCYGLASAHQLAEDHPAYGTADRSMSRLPSASFLGQWG
jgi:DNA (cytosine-5)-methyltransferase 1